MCNRCTQDPQNELAYGLRALAGIRELLVEVSCHGSNSFEVLNPQNLAELVTIVDSQLQRAGLGMENYIPRT